MSSLDDILSDKELPPAPVETPPPQESAPQPTPQAEEPPKEERARAPDGKFVAKEETPPEPAPKQELSEKERGFLKATEDERRKRQQLEKELADLRAAMQKPAPQPQPQQPEPPKTFWDDPDGTIGKVQNELAVTRQQMQMLAMQARLGAAEMVARGRHQDFDDKVKAFEEVLKASPALYQDWMMSPDPGEYAYQKGKAHMEMRELGSIDEWKARTEKALRLQIEKETREKLEKEAKERAAIPGSLSEVRGVAHHAPVWTGPTPLDNVLHDK